MDKEIVIVVLKEMQSAKLPVSHYEIRDNHLVFLFLRELSEREQGEARAIADKHFFGESFFRSAPLVQHVP